MRSARAAALADGLTLARLLLAFALIPTAATARYTATSVLVTAAWVSDMLDGRIARAAGVQDRMGRWDLTVDTTVAVALLAGMTAAGEVPVLFSVAVVVVFGGWFLTGNHAASLLLQLAGYLPLLAILWTRRPDAWWLPFSAALVIGVVDWRRLFGINIPAFIAGLTGHDIRLRRRRPVE